MTHIVKLYAIKPNGGLGPLLRSNHFKTKTAALKWGRTARSFLKVQGVRSQGFLDGTAVPGWDDRTAEELAAWSAQVERSLENVGRSIGKMLG